MTHIKSKLILLYPEYYLMILILPWQLWFLVFALLPCLPRTTHLCIDYQVHYVNSYGEIIPFCKIQRYYQSQYFSLISETFGKSLIIIHTSKTHPF